MSTSADLQVGAGDRVGIAGVSRMRQIRGLIIHMRQATRRGIPRGYRRDLVGNIDLYSGYRRGHCRWCLRPVAPPARYWHKDCIIAYRVARGTQKDYRLPHLSDRRCAQCGAADLPLEIDHRIGLALAQARGGWRELLRAYDVSNLQWLCRPCHGVKSGAERRRVNNLVSGRDEDWQPKGRSATDPGLQATLFALHSDARPKMAAPDAI